MTTPKESILPKKLMESFNYLKSSPLFNVSLTSKELFHSNFWAWMIESSGVDKVALCKVFFEDSFKGRTTKINKDKIIVEREKDNIDLHAGDDNGVLYGAFEVKSVLRTVIR